MVSIGSEKVAKSYWREAGYFKMTKNLWCVTLGHRSLEIAIVKTDWNTDLNARLFISVEKRYFHHGQSFDPLMSWSRVSLWNVHPAYTWECVIRQRCIRPEYTPQGHCSRLADETSGSIFLSHYGSSFRRQALTVAERTLRYLFEAEGWLLQTWLPLTTVAIGDKIRKSTPTNTKNVWHSDAIPVSLPVVKKRQDKVGVWRLWRRTIEIRPNFLPI